MSSIPPPVALLPVSRRKGSLRGLAALCWLWPSVVLACPVCFVAREASRLAFLWTAILMTFLPLCMMAGIIYFLWRQAQRSARENQGDASTDAPKPH